MQFELRLLSPGTVPTTQLLRHADKMKQMYSVFCVDRLLRPCIHSSKNAHEAAIQIVELATSDKYEGQFLFLFLSYMLLANTS